MMYCSVIFLGMLMAVYLPMEGSCETCDCFDVQEMIHAAAEKAITDQLKGDVLKDIKRLFNDEFVFSLNASFEKNFLKPGDNTENPITSCQELTQRNIKYDSKEYWIKPTEDSDPVKVFCNMDVTCGGIEGGWRRIAYLNMSDPTHNCPNEDFTTIDEPIRLCGSDSNGCIGTTYSTGNIEYTRVCGRVVGYQSGKPVAFHNSLYGIYGPYVEGVSITRGGYQYDHIWTFAGASDDSSDDRSSKCPCIHSDLPEYSYLVPYFADKAYFCDTALSSSNSYDGDDIIVDNPLWDGEGCSETNECCQFPSNDVKPPWFYKEIPDGTRDDIEVRLCQGSRKLGSTPIQVIELYVQ